MDEEDEEPITCDWCGHEVDEDELDEEGTCKECRDEEEHRRQLRSDYYFWCR